MSKLERPKVESIVTNNLDTWQWEGSARYRVVAERLKRAGYQPTPYGEGLTCSSGMSPTGECVIIESTVYDTNTVVGLSKRLGNFRLHELITEPKAFSIDVIYKRDASGRLNLVTGSYGPAHDDPQTFAAAFFFSLNQFSSENLRINFGKQLLDLHTTDSLERP